MVTSSDSGTSPRRDPSLLMPLDTTRNVHVVGLARFDPASRVDDELFGDTLGEAIFVANDRYFRFVLSALELGQAPILVDDDESTELVELMVDASSSNRKLTALGLISGKTLTVSLVGCEKSASIEAGGILVFPSYLLPTVVTSERAELGYAHGLGPAFR